MIRYVRSAAATKYPVSLPELKANLRVDAADEDAVTLGYLAAATNTIEEMVGKRLITQSWQRISSSASGKISIAKPPVQAITSIAYFDEANTSQTLTVGDFFLVSDEDTATLEPNNSTEWPTFYDRDDALTITFTTGYGDNPADVPESIRQAILLLASHWFENRIAVAEVQTYTVPMAVEMLVGINRKGWVAA